MHTQKCGCRIFVLESTIRHILQRKQYAKIFISHLDSAEIALAEFGGTSVIELSKQISRLNDGVQGFCVTFGSLT